MTEHPIRITPFGGCGLHNPLSVFYKSIGEPQFFTKTGFSRTPFSLSANTNLQLIDFMIGEIKIPQWIQSLAYADGQVQPTIEQGQGIFTGDIALVEMSTPIEYEFEGTLLNINRFEEVMLANLGELAAHRKLIGRWKSALRRANEDLRQTLAEEIYQYIPRGTPESENIAKFVRMTSSRTLSVEEMTKSVAELRDRLGIPIAMLLHNFNYMPDGRPVSWPADFKENSLEVARRLNLPMLDPESYVRHGGVANVLEDDRRHWNPAHFAPVGKIFYDFCLSVLDQATPASSLSSGSADKAAQPTPLQAEAPRQAGGVARRYLYDPASGGHFPADPSVIYTVIVLGGAWATGANSDLEDAAASRVPEHPGKALMFETGLRSRGREPKAFTDLREKSSGSSKETPAAGIADQVMRNAEIRFGIKPQMLFFSISRVGTSISGCGMSEGDGLLRGSIQHQEVMRLVERASTIAAGRGQQLAVAAICLLHGEYEVSEGMAGSTYRRLLSSLQLQYDADIRVVTGQVEPVRLYLTQTGRVSPRPGPEIPMAQLNAKFDNPYVQCVGPTYFIRPERRSSGTPAYPTSIGYRWIGQLFGRFLLDDLWGRPRDPLRIEDARWVGSKTIRVRYNRAVALEQDDSRINISDLGPSLGFDFSDGTAWSPAIEAVRPVKSRDAELDIELNAPSPGFSRRLSVATRLTGGGSIGRHQGARSGIRSKSPFDTDPLDGTELFDWACTEVVQLS